MRYGDKLEALLMVQDERMQSLARAAGVQMEPIFQSNPARDLIRELNQMGERDDLLKSMLAQGEAGTLQMNKIRAQETEFVISPARSICFTQTSLAGVPHDTYTTVDLNNTRGMFYDKDPRNYGCVDYVPGYTNRFTKKDWVPEEYPIFFFGDFGFSENGTGSREIYIEFFDKDDVSLGGYTFACRAAPSDWTNMPFFFMDWFSEGDYCTFQVWQDSTATLGITSANLGFMLG